MKGKFRFGLFLSALTLAVVTVVSSGAMPARIATAQEPEGTNAVVAWDTDGNTVNKKAFIGTTNNRALVLKTKNEERVRVTQTGNVGIGSKTPAQTLEVNGITSMGTPGGVYGFRVQDDAGEVYPTLSFNATGAPNYASGSDGYAGIFQFHNQTGYLSYYTGQYADAGGARTNTPRLTISANGMVGIGTTDPANTLDVGGTLEVHDPNTGLYSLFVGTDRTVSVGELGQSTTKHLCYFGTYTISSCSSAAEYVPSVDGGKGFPETADLVSIISGVKNPYGDAHGPFVVQKSTKACDPNLLGYIVKPESGADGVNLNEHYMPLAIYGFFPAKVTMQNGPIKRGDPITSSARAGYGMKATDACKVIGYALEDATKDGTIQVFANFGDNSAAQVTALQKENQTLKKQLSALDDRLAALENPTLMKVGLKADMR